MQINPIEALNKLKKIKKTPSAEFSLDTSITRNTKDTVSVSSQAKVIQEAIEFAKAANVDNREKVEQLKQSIKDGSYKVDSQVLVDKISSKK